MANLTEFEHSSTHAMTETRVPVLIIGGGIVGLSASICLAHHGIHSVLVERHFGTSIHPRARSVNTRTMEIYRSLGIEDVVREAGSALSASMGIYTGTSLKEVIECKPRKEGGRKFPLAGLFTSISPVTGAWGTLDMIEPVLLETARTRGVDARFYTECLGVEQNEDGVTATLHRRDEVTHTCTIRADYLIAADGAESPIRKRLGVKTSGRGTMGHLLNILFHADLKELVHQREFSLCIINRPEVSGLFTAINNDDRWVFHLHYDPSKGDKLEDFTPERCKELLRIALGIHEIEIDIKSILPWEPSVQVAEKFQHGRIFLAGDAAHQMPPWAGQGANSGVADAHNLAWKLAAVLQGRAGPGLLSTYDVERLPVGRTAAEVSAAAADERGLITMKKSLSLISSIFQRAFIISGHGYTYSSQAIATESTFPLGGISWKAWSLPSLALALDGRPGSRAPHIWIEHQGKRISTLDLFGKSFVLLAGSDGKAWCETARKASITLNIDIDCYTTGPKGNVNDPFCQWQTAAGISSQGALLVRPDGFVCLRERRLPLGYQQKLELVLKQILSR
jgi:putative polyketide hydroxylase